MSLRRVVPSSVAFVLLFAGQLHAAGYIQTNLVSDQPNVALITDPNLVNPWGVTHTATSPFWVSNNVTSVSTLYQGDAAGAAFSKNPLVVTIPGGSPTGIVFSAGTDFIVTSGSASGPARFIFATQTGNLVGWSPNVPAPGSTTGVIAHADPADVYTGLAIGNNGTSNFLYAADFKNANISVYDNTFAPATLAGSFTDPSLPVGYAPFNITNLGGTLYVAYAPVDPTTGDEMSGPGNGVVDTFDTNGNFLTRVVSNGLLNDPWGMAIAPAGFGTFAGSLLVGNFGDGRINAFNATTGASLGTVSDVSGTPITIDGLWGIIFGNGANGGDANTLYFAAGSAGETHGLFGKLTANLAAATNTIVVTGTRITPVEGTSFSGNVGSFSDANGGGPYTVTINWGDGSATTAGVATSSGANNFIISGTHTYAEETTVAGLPVMLSVTDTSDAGVGTGTGTAVVGDAPLTGSSVSVVAPLNTTFNGAVATFTEANPSSTAADFTATINWGDGSPVTAGVITKNGSTFTVSGSHVYTTGGASTVTVTVNDIGGSSVTITSTANAPATIPMLDPRALVLLMAALAATGILLSRRT